MYFVLSSRRFSLMVMHVPSITALGLRSLREISDGNVYLSNNANLCYHHTVNGTRLFTGHATRLNDIKDNRPLRECGEAGLQNDMREASQLLAVLIMQGRILT